MAGLFPHIYDTAMKPLEKMRFEKIRAGLVRKAQGKVLEIGFGTGANFRYYQNVERVDAIEPNPAMGHQAVKRIKKLRIPMYLYQAKAEQLPFVDNSFDSVVATLVFCTIPDPELALQEIRRVSKPGAKFLLFEHVKMDQKMMGKTQEALTPIWKKLCDGCHLNRDTLGLVKQSGWDIQKVTSHYDGLFLTIECQNPRVF
ncbi:type 11 methyltransferase [Planococcus antarcticus DSM 14505]|uniref:Methyltransferase type 11 n=1 Tax=Planococcus antarcticus DSM 14505 TaxID=1185653 RepID=A0A1C7DHS0_9BACL|nr:class I SAM-dependent methyltransferase [Planococcus antarcticus]ANU10948.1 methyltransferase type 11 [Planococcus antarcticus DSM 14505]EIM05040.1 type 11 methyltransferase [Planococcus antarcticus DSM 14505]